MITIDDLRASDRATVTLHEVAEILGVDSRTVSGAVRSGEIPAVRVGRRVLIPRHRFLAFLDGEQASAAAPVSANAFAESRDPLNELRGQLLRVLLAPDAEVRTTAT